MDYLKQIDSTHQLQAVQKAIKTIQMEVTFEQEQINVIEKYFHYLYGIGCHQGARQTSHRKRIIGISPNGVERMFESITEVAGVLGVNKSSITKSIVKGHYCKGMLLSFETK